MRGKISAGLGQGRYFISREGCIRQFLNHPQPPFPGTLNVLLEEPFLAGVLPPRSRARAGLDSYLAYSTFSIPLNSLSPVKKFIPRLLEVPRCSKWTRGKV